MSTCIALAWLALTVAMAACGAAPQQTDSSERVARTGQKAPEILMPAPSLDDIELRDQHGKPVMFTSLRGKPTLLCFIYTRCPMPEMCPATTLRFQEVQEALPVAARSEVRLLSLSFDPAFDTPSVLAEYAALWGVDDDVWLMLTGSGDDIHRVAAAYGVWYEKGADGNFRHPMYSMVLLPDGSLHRVLLGSAWDAQEIADLLRQLAFDGGAARR